MKTLFVCLFRVYASVSNQLDPSMNLQNTFFKPDLLRLSGIILTYHVIMLPVQPKN